MSPPPPIPQQLWDQAPPELQAAVLSLVQSFEQRISALEARLGQDSTNSSKPPSSGPLHTRRHPPRPASGKGRGGQPGHRRHARELVAPQRLTAVIDVKPGSCRGCGYALRGMDSKPVRHQVTELPEVRPEVIEYRLHRLACPRCGRSTRGELPTGVPRGAFGPRLQAAITLFAGAYRLSKRQVQAILADFFGLSVSLGMVSKTERRAAEAVAVPVEEVYEHVRSAGVAGVDETGWREGKRRAWLWAAVTDEATAFRIDRSRGGEALHALLGEPITPVVVSDRFPTYARAPNRQTCWAHLRRDFQSMIDRAAGGQGVGARLLKLCDLVFAWWRRYQAGSVHRQTLRGYVAGIKPVVRSLLESGAACSCAWTAKVCRKLLSAEATLWIFAAVEGVPPHNNATERALRHGVLWRKTSHGTDGESGSRFVGRVLTVLATCRQRGRSAFGYLTGCFKAAQGRAQPPMLLS